MLSKEEYTLANLREHCIKTMQFSNRNSNTYKEHELVLTTIDENISLKYKVEQLETNNKNLIEYIEKKMSEYDETIIELVLQNVLAVAKGEKE